MRSREFMVSDRGKATLGALLIFVSAILFGSYGVWSKLIGSSFGPFFQGWTRGLIILVILFPVLYFKKLITPIQKQHWKWLAVFLTFTSATAAPIFYAFNHMDIGTATLLFYVSMLLTMYVVGFLFLGEKITNVKIVSFIVALAGLLLIFSFSLEKFALLAALAAVINGIASGGEVSSSKKLSDVYSPLYLTALSWLAVVPTNVALSLLVGETQVVPTFSAAWLWQLCYVGASIFAFWLIIRGLKYVEASIGGLIGLLEVVFGIVFGIFFFKESLTVKMIMGAVLILFAASLPYLSGIWERHNR